ncbi:hypothetical protein K457DRAFT_141988 [Linnemannia elongata AG-77]|uniref:Alcohol acetyltransferase n=1 Tax=Linnemannia elongata AG-77 TaxID=1314771 RepID=A0A197JHC2_9FUNG|nr:hypothetical protein K457DRAFT_141988 [Linnemannia elongata AG-77]
MSFPLVRKVGNVERYSLARANAQIYKNVVVGACLHEQPKSGSTPPTRDHAQWVQLLTGPLTWLIQEHPNLSVVIGDHLSAMPVFLQMPSVDLSRIIRVTSVDRQVNINAVLEDEHQAHFDNASTEVPLWRIVVVEVKEDGSFFLLYCYQHTIGDGRAGLGLVEQLIERLNIQAATDEPQTLPSVVAIPSTVRPMPDNMEAIVDCTPSLGLLVKEAVTSLLLPGFVKRALEKKYWSGEFDATLEVPNETQVVAMYLTKEETAQVVEAAKAHKTTVHVILLAASAFATKLVFLSKTAGDNHQGPTTTKDAMKFTSPCTLRPVIGAPLTPYVQGNYTSEIASKNVKIKFETEFWDVAQRFRKQLVAEISKPKGLYGHVGLLSYLPKEQGGWEKFLREQVEKEQHGREATLQISNLGIGMKQSADSSPAFKVLNAVFSQSSSITAASLTFNAATANGVLLVTSTWQKSSFTGRDRGELHMKEFKRILLEATQPDRTNYRFREVFAAPLATIKSQ